VAFPGSDIRTTVETDQRSIFSNCRPGISLVVRRIHLVSVALESRKERWAWVFKDHWRLWQKVLHQFNFPGGLEWSLRFKSESAREQAHQALVAIRELGKSANKTSDKSSAAEQKDSSKKAENKKPKESSSHSRSGKSADAEQPKNGVDNKSWHEVLGVAPDASIEEIKIAHRDAIKKCHPDTVATRSELIKQVAAAEAKQINMAYRDAQTLRGF
jgi:DnaJ-domain-containing protein 1